MLLSSESLYFPSANVASVASIASIDNVSDRIDWQQAIAAFPMGIVIADAQAPDFPAIYVNPAFERETGYAAAVIEHNFRFLQGNDHNQPEIAQIRQALLDQTRCTVMLRNYRKDGSLFWNELTLTPILDAQGQMVQVVGIQNNISDRVRAEQERQQAKAQNNTIPNRSLL